jgi:tetratricopeptide (TPR) repeat protein
MSKHPVFSSGLVMSLLLSTACSSTPVTANKPVTPPLSALEIEARGFSSPAQEALYHALVGEFAGFAEDYTQAATYFLKSARINADVRLARRAAEMALYSKEYTIAQEAVTVWQALKPSDMEAQHIESMIFLRQGNIEASVKALDKIFSTSSETEQQSLPLLAKLLGREVDNEHALSVLEQLSPRYPQQYDMQLFYANLLYEAERIDQAHTVLEGIFAQSPYYPKAISLYLQVLRRLDKLTYAVTWMQNLVTTEPKNMAWRELYAHLLVTLGRHADALPHFQALLAAEPDNSNHIYNFGITAIRAQDGATARQHLNKLLGVADSEIRNLAHYLLGELAEEEHAREDALSWYRQVEEGNRYYINAQGRIVLILMAQGKGDEALTYLNNITLDDPDDEQSMRTLEAEIFIREQRYEEALNVYNQLLEDDPDNIDLLYLRAMLGERMDDLELLERDLRAILTLEAENAEALNALGYTLADRTTRYQEAYELIKKALALRPGAYHILDSMGWVLYRLERYSEALEYLRRALELNYDPEIASHLGEVLWIMGAHEEAQQVWNKALESFPEDEGLRKVMERLMP